MRDYFLKHRSLSIPLCMAYCLLQISDANAASEVVTPAQKIEQRLQSAEQVIDTTVTDAEIRKDYYLNREYAINQVLLQQAKEARAKGDYQTAKALYTRILGIAPNNQYAIAGIQATARESMQAQRLKKAQTLIKQTKYQEAKVLVHDVLIENPQHPLAKELNETIGGKLGDSNAQLPQLGQQFKKPVSLEFRNANIKLVFDALSRDTGINFILDKDIRPDTRANVFVQNVSIEEAIDTVIASNGLAKKITSENTVIIYPRNALKNKAYQELLIRNFYLNNTQAKDVADLLKSMIKTKNVYVYERLNMLVVRDRPEVINLAEKLVNSMDLADPEVMLEIEVLEVTRDRLLDLGIDYPSRLAVLNATATEALTLESLKSVNQSRIGVSSIVGNPAVNFRGADEDVNLLSNPRVRVKNNEKAQIQVGDKIPIITNVTTQFSNQQNVEYQDVGLKVEVEPHITLDNFVDLKVGLEVSNLGRATALSNGGLVYEIGARSATTSLRLKDGETQILAGLIQDEDRSSINKLPGLGDIPLLGRLFSNHNDSDNKTEIVLAITPRVLGNIPLPSAQFTEYWSGTANHVTDKIKKTPAAAGGPAPNTGGNSALRRLMQQRQQRKTLGGNTNNTTPSANFGAAAQPNGRANSPQTTSDDTVQKEEKKSFIPDVQFLK